MTARIVALALTAMIVLPGIAGADNSRKTAGDAGSIARAAAKTEGERWVLNAVVWDKSGRRAVADFYRDAGGVRFLKQVQLRRSGRRHKVLGVGRTRPFCQTKAGRPAPRGGNAAATRSLRISRCAFRLGR